MTTPETTIEPSAPATTNPEDELTPRDDVTRPALYRNPDPKPGHGESVHDQIADMLMGLDGRLLRRLPVKRNFLLRRVMTDVLDRRDLGEARYGTTLQVGNGRHHLIDAYQEALDGLVYLYSALSEDSSDRALRDLFESHLVLLLNVRRTLAVRNGELEPDDDGNTPAASD